MNLTPEIKIMLIIILLLILLILYNITPRDQNIQLILYKQKNPNMKTSEQMNTDGTSDSDPTANQANSIPMNRSTFDNLSAGPVVINNPINDALAIRQYDYNKIYNPLENPARRVPNYELPPYYVKRLIDYPTRGYPDNYTQYGILKKVSHRPTGEHFHDNHDNNNSQGNNFIIRLFGRQEFPGSNKYDYYTMVNNGLDQIKIPIYSRRQELYDGDDIFIKELDSKYIVSLYKYDEPKYYPDLIY